MPSGHDYNAIQAYLARSLQLNLMEEMPPAPYPARDKKILHLGYVFPKTFLNLICGREILILFGYRGWHYLILIAYQNSIIEKNFFFEIKMSLFLNNI